MLIKTIQLNLGNANTSCFILEMSASTSPQTRERSNWPLYVSKLSKNFAYEALLTTLCLGRLHFACGTFIKRQSMLEGLSSLRHGC